MRSIERAIEMLLQDPLVSSYVNIQVFVAVLLALLVYRIVAPVVDILNPLSILADVVVWCRNQGVSLVRLVVRRIVRKHFCDVDVTYPKAAATRD